MKNIYISPQCVNAFFSDITTVSYKKLLMKINTHRSYVLDVDNPSMSLQHS